MGLNTYMFHKEPKELAKKLLDSFYKLNSYGASSNLYLQWRKSYSLYYGSNASVIGVGVAGEQGEFATTTVNHIRSLIQHIFNLTTQNKLVFDAMANNSDPEARHDAIVANHALDYFFYSKSFEQQCKTALEISLIMGTAFLACTWELDQELIGKDEEGGAAFKGAPKLKTYSPLDVILDPTKDDFGEQNFVCLRDTANRWDLIARYPEAETELKATKNVAAIQNFLPQWRVDDDTIYVYKAYHKPTPAIPNGIFMLFTEEAVLEYGNNPYHQLPVFCLRPAIKYGGAYGHTPLFDLIPLQETVDLLSSSILTNQQAFAVQNIIVPDTANIKASEIPGALNILRYKPLPELQGGGKPEALQLCATPQEVFRFLDSQVAAMESISGINAAARGNPPASLSSGTAIALVTTAASQYNSAIESGYVSAVEHVASFLCELLAAYMSGEELIAVTGKMNQSSVVSFKSSTFKKIKRVKITVGNGLSKTFSGRLEIANNLLNTGIIKNAGDYITVLTTGQIDNITEKSASDVSLAQEENNDLLKGIPVQMLAFDNHEIHLSTHKMVLSKPEIRRGNPQFLQNALTHIQEHIDALESMALSNPLTLAVALDTSLSAAAQQMAAMQSQMAMTAAQEQPGQEGKPGLTGETKGQRGQPSEQRSSGTSGARNPDAETVAARATELAMAKSGQARPQ